MQSVFAFVDSRCEAFVSRDRKMTLSRFLSGRFWVMVQFFGGAAHSSARDGMRGPSGRQSTVQLEEGRKGDGLALRHFGCRARSGVAESPISAISQHTELRL